MGAVCTRGGELQHQRSQGGDHDGRFLLRLRAAIERLADRFEVLAHLRHRRFVLVAAQVGNEVGVGDAEPENEAARQHLGQRLVDRPRRHRVASVDVRDAGGVRDALRAGAEICDQRERVATDRLGRPQRSVALRFDGGRELRRLGRREAVESGPDAKPAKDVRGIRHRPSALPPEIERRPYQEHSERRLRPGLNRGAEGGP